MGQMYLVSNEFCNLYSAILLDTGRGKDGVLRGMTNMLGAAGYKSLVGASSFSSGPGMLHELMERNGRVVWPIDELAPDLRAIVTSNSASHKEEVLSYLLSMYTRKTFVKRLAKSHFEITDPCPSVCAGCQPSLFWGSATNQKMLESGFVNRFLIFPGNNYAIPKRTHMRYVEPDVDVVSYLTGFDTSEYGPGTVNDVEGNRKEIEPTAEASAFLEDQNNKTYAKINADKDKDIDVTNALLCRNGFKALKIAAIYAWLRDYNNPIIDLTAAKYAYAIVDRTSTALLKSIEKNTYKSQIEGDLKAMLRFVIGAGEKGVPLDKLRKQCQSFALTFTKVLEHAFAAHDIRYVTAKGANNKDVVRVVIRQKEESDD